MTLNAHLSRRSNQRGVHHDAIGTFDGAPRRSMSCAASGISIEASIERSMRESVREIEHSSSNREEISCGPIRLRVKSDLKFGCSIRWSNKRRSITELNSDSHSRNFIVSKRHANETTRSWVVAPASNQASLSQQRSPSSTNAGLAPAFVLRATKASGARGAGFISVSGFGADRSALHSDMRLSKRTSGSAAATEPLHAPMNSPKVSRFAAAGGFRFQPSSTH
jgi:hypothetical protein